METITITFGDVAENHVGNQQIGDICDSGFTNEELDMIKNFFENRSVVCEMVNLNEYLPADCKADEARILIIRNGVNSLLSQIDMNKDNLFDELTSFEWDTKVKMYGRVVNKHARHNICFSNEAQEPDYESGKGRIIAWQDVPLLSVIKNDLEDLLRVENKEKEIFQGEGNRYYDIQKCGIGFHGDSERRKVLALRVGASMKMCFHWYLANNPVGSKFEMMINGGDIYVMNWKASGFDWKKRKIYVLRHAAGCDKYTKLKEKKVKKEKKVRKVIIKSDSDDSD